MGKESKEKQPTEKGQEDFFVLFRQGSEQDDEKENTGKQKKKKEGRK